MKFYAEGRNVFRETPTGPVKIASVNPAMLTPGLLAKEIADAMNDKLKDTRIDRVKRPERQP